MNIILIMDTPTSFTFAIFNTCWAFVAILLWDIHTKMSCVRYACTIRVTCITYTLYVHYRYDTLTNRTDVHYYPYLSEVIYPYWMYASRTFFIWVGIYSTLKYEMKLKESWVLALLVHEIHLNVLINSTINRICFQQTEISLFRFP